MLAYEKHVAGIQAKASSYVGKIESGKLAEIQGKAQTKAAELKSQALNEEWAPLRLEVELVKAQAAAEVDLIKDEMPKGPAIHGSRQDSQPEAIQAAFALSCGLRDREKYFKPEVLEAADKHYKRIGIQEVLVHFARQAGYEGRAKITTDNLREVIQAAFSIHSITTMLTQTGNKILLKRLSREISQVVYQE